MAPRCPGEPLKVAIVTPTIARAGGGIFPIVNAHARELSVREDTAVVVHGLVDDPGGLDRAVWRGIDLRTYPARLRGISPGLRRDLLATDAEVIHQHVLWLFPSAAVSAARRRRGVPVVISTHGMLEPWALANSAAKKRIAAALFERSNLSGAAAIHCSAAEVAGVRSYGVRAPIAVIPNGVDLPDLSPSQRPAFMPEGTRTLLFLGRLHPKKGIAELLEALARLPAIAPEVAAAWRVAIVGWDDGGHAAGLEARAKALGLSDSVVFPGPLFGEEKRAALINSDAFVLPSFSEGFPMAVLEAWAHALPVLITAECNLPDGFEVGAAVEITTDPRALAASLARALADPGLAEMGRRGRAHVAERYSWPAVAEELVSVYRWLALGTGRPACVLTD